MEYMTITQILIFAGVSFLNVVFQTVRVIITTSGTKKAAALSSAFAFGLYFAIISMVADAPMEIGVAVAVVTNLVGVYLGMWILEKVRKPVQITRKISVTLRNVDDAEPVMEALNAQNIPFQRYTIHRRGGDSTGLDIFADNSNEAEIIKSIITQYDMKYHVTIVNHTI
jgi:uncharacterized protein YebE (UPF0316 family)